MIYSDCWWNPKYPEMKSRLNDSWVRKRSPTPSISKPWISHFGYDFQLFLLSNLIVWNRKSCISSNEQGLLYAKLGVLKWYSNSHCLCSPTLKSTNSIPIVIVSTKECLCFPHFEDDKVAFKFSGSFHESVIGWKHLTTCGSVSSWRMNTSYSLQLFIESCGIVIVIKETLICWHIWHLFVLVRETPLPTRCPLENLKRFHKKYYF